MLNILAMVKSVAMKIGVHVSFGIKVFSRNMPTSEVLGHMVILFFFSFKGAAPLFTIVALPVYMLTDSARRLPFLHTLSRNYCL